MLDIIVLSPGRAGEASLQCLCLGGEGRDLELGRAIPRTAPKGLQFSKDICYLVLNPSVGFSLFPVVITVWVLKGILWECRESCNCTSTHCQVLKLLNTMKIEQP